MRTASMVLGIVGGALAILTGIMFILMGAYFIDGSFFFGGFDYYDSLDGFYNSFTSTMFTVYLVLGILTIAAGALGLTGGIIVKKKNVTAGILLIIGAVLTFSIPLILAAIFALVKEKEPVPAYGYAPQYPASYYPPQYAPYPAQYAPYPPQYTPYPPQQPTAPASDNAPTDQKPQE